jgi:hypothetical protein
MYKSSVYGNDFYPFNEYMLLKIFVDSDDEALIQKYVQSASDHNEKLLENPSHYDSGFSIYFPEDITLSDIQHQVCIDYKIKCCAEMYKFDLHTRVNGVKYATGFHTYVRSGPTFRLLRLSNNHGIIDSGYRDNIIVELDKMNNQPATFGKFTTLMQICAPNLLPIKVVIVDSLEGSY